MTIDYPYIIFILLLIGFTIQAFNGRDTQMFRFSCILTLLFIGLRAPVIGADTWNYYRFFTGIRDYYNNDEREIEPLFLFYNWVLGFVLFKQGQLYIFFNTFLSLFMIYKYYQKYSGLKTVSVLFFFFMVSYPNYFVALRQILGISVLLLGFKFVMDGVKNRWIFFGVCSAIGYGFHTFTIIASAFFVFFYYIRFKNRLLPVLLLVASSLFGVVLKSFNITQFFDLYLSLNLDSTERLNDYMENSELWMEDNGANIFILLRQTLVAIYVILLIPKEKLNSCLTGLYVFAVCIQSLFDGIVLLGRIVLPFTIMGPIVFSWIFVNKIKYKGLLLISVILITMYFTRAFIIDQIDYDKYSNEKLHPYYFFFEDYSNHYSLKDPDY